MPKNKFNREEIRIEALKLYDEGYTERSFVVKLISEKHGTVDRNIYTHFSKIAMYDANFANKFNYDSDGKAIGGKGGKGNKLGITTNKIEEIKNIDLNKINYTELAGMEGMAKLVSLYAERIHKPSASEVEALEEQYLFIKARQHDSVDWLSKIIKEVSKKEDMKQNIQYIIGMVRHRAKYGWGATKSSDEEAIIKAVEEILEIELDTETASWIFKLISKYGIVKVTLGLTKAKEKIDLRKAYLTALENYLDNAI